MTPNERFHSEPLIADILADASRKGRRVRAIPTPLDGPRSYGATETFFRAMPFDTPAYMIVTEHRWNPHCEERHMDMVKRGAMVYESEATAPPVLEVTRTGQSMFYVRNFDSGIEEDITLHDLIFLCALLLHPTYPHQE